MRLTSEQLTIGFIFAGVATLACLAPVQSDTWWLLRAGRESWQSGRVTLTDTYSYTAAGSLWPNHEWLTELIFYGLFSLGGLPLVTAICASVMVATWALSWRLARGSFEVRVLMLAACLTCLPASFAIRPQVFSMFLFMVTCTLLVERRWWWLILVFMLWTNLHGAVALGIVAVGAAWLASFFSREPLVKLTGVGAACFGATLVSPQGWRLWPEMLVSIERSRVNALREWQPPTFGPENWPFWILALVFPIIVVWRWRAADSRTRTLAVIALAVLPLAARSMRNVHIFLLAAMPAVPALVSRMRPVPRRQPAREHEFVNAAVMGLAALVAMAVVALAWRAPAPRLGWQPISTAAAAAIRDCEAPLYNTYGQGGYLIWFVPEKRVFIDNRQDPYSVELLAASRKMEMDGGYEPVFEKYGIRCAAVPPGSPLAARLQSDTAWSLGYNDAEWAVFTRR
jgi:hypothetical protein